MSILGLLAKGFEIAAVEWVGTKKGRWWRYIFLRTNIAGMERSWTIGSFNLWW